MGATISNCTSSFPSSQEYLSDIGGGDIALLAIASFLTLAIIIIYLEELCYIWRSKELSSKVKNHRRVLLAIYPLTACMSLISLFVPRTSPLAELICQLYLSLCLFYFLLMMIGHLGGVKGMTRTLSDHHIKWRAPPCCCCCYCLPSKNVSKTQVRIIQGLVLQMVIVKPLIVLFTTIIFTDTGSQTMQSRLANPVTLIKSFGSGITITLAMYGLILMYRVSRNHLKGTHILLKFLCLKLSILFIDAQNSIIVMLPTFGAIPCSPPFGPNALASYIQHALLIPEMFGVALLACYAYRKQGKHGHYQLLDDKDADNYTKEDDNKNEIHTNEHPPANGSLSRQISVASSYGSLEDL